MERITVAPASAVSWFWGCVYGRDTKGNRSLAMEIFLYLPICSFEKPLKRIGTPKKNQKRAFKKLGSCLPSVLGDMNPKEPFKKDSKWGYNPLKKELKQKRMRIP